MVNRGRLHIERGNLSINGSRTVITNRGTISSGGTLTLEKGESQPYTPFDREAGFALYAGWPLDRLLDEFTALRQASLHTLDTLDLKPADLARRGRHPELGPVTLEQLVATWVTSDCAHLAQIARVLTKYHGRFAGPWRRYFSLLRAAAG